MSGQAMNVPPPPPPAAPGAAASPAYASGNPPPAVPPQQAAGVPYPIQDQPVEHKQEPPPPPGPPGQHVMVQAPAPMHAPTPVYMSRAPEPKPVKSDTPMIILVATICCFWPCCPCALFYLISENEKYEQEVKEWRKQQQQQPPEQQVMVHGQPMQPPAQHPV
eukprot:jgi/Ulvmu1/12431/UM009_0082.1